MQSLGMEPSLSIGRGVHADCGFLHPDALHDESAARAREPDDPRSGICNRQLVANAAAGTPGLLTTRDVLRHATMNGAKHLRLDHKIGSLTPGKEADIIILDAEAINVAPLNQVPGAVVSLMDRSNVETVIVAGKVRKWKGKLLDVDLPHLRRQLDASRDDIFAAAGIPQDRFRSN